MSTAGTPTSDVVCTQCGLCAAESQYESAPCSTGSQLSVGNNRVCTAYTTNDCDLQSGYCYRFSMSTTGTYAEVDQICRAMDATYGVTGTTIATVTSMSTLQVMVAHIQTVYGETTHRPTTYRTWLGGKSTDAIRWDDGSPFLFARWIENPPDPYIVPLCITTELPTGVNWAGWDCGHAPLPAMCGRQTKASAMSQFSRVDAHPRTCDRVVCDNAGLWATRICDDQRDVRVRPRVCAVYVWRRFIHQDTLLVLQICRIARPFVYTLYVRR